MNFKTGLKWLLAILLVFFISKILIPRTIEFPLIQSMSYFPYGENHLLEKGEMSLNLDLYYSNIHHFNHYRTVINDFESFSNSIGFRYGLTKTMNLELYLRWSFIHAGFLDSTIEGFHDLFQIPDTNRAEFPRNSIQYRYKEAFAYDRKQTHWSPFIVSLFKELYSKEAITLNGRVSFGLPLKNVPGFSTDKPFFTTGLILVYKKKNFMLDFANYLSWTGRPSWLEREELGKSVWLSNIEIVLKRFVGGLSFRTSFFQKGDMAHNAYQLYLGYKITKRVEFLIIEDFAPFDTSPDLSLSLRIKVL